MKSISKYISKIGFSLVLLIFVFSLNQVYAQDEMGDKKKSTYEKVRIGVSGGVNLPWMEYSDPDGSLYDFSWFVRPTVGIFSEINFTERFFIRPELLYKGRGVSIEDQGVDYLLKANYFDFQLPFAFRILKDKAVNPYISIGPYVGYAFSGSYDIDGTPGDLSKASISEVDFGGLASLGFEFPFLVNNRYWTAGVEGGYSMGFVDTFSDDELSGDANAVNLTSYDVVGTRKNRGVFARALIAIPISKAEEPMPEEAPMPMAMKVAPEPMIDEVDDDEPLIVGLKEIEELPDPMDELPTQIEVDNVEFVFGGDEIREDSKMILQEIVKLYDEYPGLELIISGHTDNKGSEEFNMELSRKRVISVYQYLIDKGVDSDQISYQYFGETRPIATNDTEEGRDRNRRVEFLLKDY